MAGQIDVQVVDCNLAPISGANITMPGSTFRTITDQTGKAQVPAAAKQALHLNVAHPYFVTEDVEFQPDVQTGTWNNALVSRQVADDTVSLKIQLGRCATAPTVFLDAGAIADLASSQGANSQGVLLFNPSQFPNVFAYRYQNYQTWSVQVARQFLLPDQTPANDKKGWDRFASDASPDLAIADLGRFFWLVYPQQPTDSPRQYVVAIWSPNLQSDQPVNALNMVVFFSPNTSKYKGSYPFGVVAGATSKDTPDQPYMTLGKKYLLDEYCFAYEMAAGSNPAVLVMPICAQGDWGPFASADGLFRLLREVAVFLQRECRTSNLGTQQTGYDPAYRLAGGSLRTSGSGIRATDFGLTPAVGQVAVSFFSDGVAPANQVIASSGWWNVTSGFAEQYWGTSSGQGSNNSRAAWAASWVELWDLDGAHQEGWDAYLNLVQTWYGQNSSRIFRLWHADGTRPGTPPPASHRIWQTLGAATSTLTVPASGSFGAAYERHGQRWSTVTFADSYVADGSVDVRPVLSKSAHHATPCVAFSHARTLTSIGVRQAISFQRGP